MHRLWLTSVRNLPEQKPANPTLVRCGQGREIVPSGAIRSYPVTSDRKAESRPGSAQSNVTYLTRSSHRRISEKADRSGRTLRRPVRQAGPLRAGSASTQTTKTCRCRQHQDHGVSDLCCTACSRDRCRTRDPAPARRWTVPPAGSSHAAAPRCPTSSQWRRKRTTPRGARIARHGVVLRGRPCWWRRHPYREAADPPTWPI